MNIRYVDFLANDFYKFLLIWFIKNTNNLFIKVVNKPKYMLIINYSL